jgi:hypothetical protein
MRHTTSRLDRLEAQVATLPGRQHDVQTLAHRQRMGHRDLCRALGSHVPYPTYLACWEDAEYLHYLILRASAPWALREWASAHCPQLVPAVNTFLQRPRYVDPLFCLDHSYYWIRSPHAYRFFITLLVQASDACLQNDDDQAAELLLAILQAHTPEATDWTDDTTLAVIVDALQATLDRLWEEYRAQVLNACYRWHPGMTYAYYYSCRSKT